MPQADASPAVGAGGMYFVRDRMAEPNLLVTARAPVPGTQLWVVTDARGHEFVCREGCLAPEPSDSCIGALRNVVP